MIQISCCRPGWVREGINPSPTKILLGRYPVSSIYFQTNLFLFRLFDQPIGLFYFQLDFLQSGGMFF